MLFSFNELKDKEVIDKQTGSRIGYVDDVVMNFDGKGIESIVVFGRPRVFGLLGREDDLVIDFCDIDLIGEDTILVSLTNSKICTKEKRFELKNLLK